MQYLQKFLMLMSVMCLVSCGASRVKKWAGQSVVLDLTEHIAGHLIEKGYRSPWGTFDIHFPISEHLIGIADAAIPSEIQTAKFPLIDFVGIKNFYGYGCYVASMKCADAPAISELDHDWVVENLNGSQHKPTTSVVHHDPSYGDWRLMTYGPIKIEDYYYVYRIEALVIYDGLLYRIVIDNDIVHPYAQKQAGLSDAKVMKIVEESTKKNFYRLWEKIVLNGTKVKALPQKIIIEVETAKTVR